MEHLVDGNLDMWVSGSGSRVSSHLENIAQTKFASSTAGFGLHEVTATSFTSTFISHKGDKMYTITRNAPGAAAKQEQEQASSAKKSRK